MPDEQIFIVEFEHVFGHCGHWALSILRDSWKY